MSKVYLSHTGRVLLPEDPTSAGGPSGTLWPRGHPDTQVNEGPKEGAAAAPLEVSSGHQDPFSDKPPPVWTCSQF